MPDDSLHDEATLQTVARLAVPHLADWCIVDVAAPDGAIRRVAVAHRDAAQEKLARDIASRWPFRPDAVEGVPRVIRTGTSALYPDIDDALLVAIGRHREYVDLLRGLGLRTGMIVPLIARGAVLGALSLWSVRPGRRYGMGELTTVERLARWAALALDNARLLAESQARLRETKTLLAVSQALSGTFDLTETMRRVARQIARTLGGDMAGAFLADAARATLRPIAGYRVPEHLAERLLTVPVPIAGYPAIQEAWTRGEPVWSDDVARDPRVDRETFERFPHRSHLFVPMVVKAEPVGGFFVVWWRGRHRCTPDELRLVQGISAQAAIFVESARLYAEANRRRQEAEELARVARTLTETLDVAEVGDRIVQAVLRLFGAGSSIVRLLEADGSLTCLALAGRSLAGYRPGCTLPPGTGMVGRAVAERRPVWTADVLNEPGITLPVEFRSALGEAGHHAVLAVPLEVKGEIIGALSIAHHDVRTFSDAEVTLLQTFGDQAALAIRNVQLFAREQAARAEAQAASRAKDEFLAMLGHELRNPLAAIAAAVRVLQALGQRDERGARFQQLIARQTNHLARILDDLLDVGRVTAGKIVLRRRAVDLNEVTEFCLRSLEESGRTSAHAVEAAGEPAPVDGDPTRLEQVVFNLLDNALKYTPPGGRIRVRVAREGGEAVLRVEDTGIGIAPEMLPRIFELFAQGDRSLDRAQGGLGLGLTLVRRLVEMHDGSVSAASPGLGLGTEFVVRLPLRPLGSPPAAPEAPRPADRPRRVLLIEDNDDARASIRAVLELAGHAVQEAREGHEGLKAALMLRPDVALVDLGLPGLDGFQIARAVRAETSAARLALVALTGYGRLEDLQRAAEAGFDEHLVKPVDANRLLALLQELPRRR